MVNYFTQAKACGYLLIAILLLSPLLCYADEDKEVITFEDIEKERPSALMELLKKRVGLGDSNGAITLRGIPKVSVYLDGVPVGGAVVWLDRIKPEDVERIEIYRGAASSRFGADALGGAIVITTKKGKKEMHLNIIQGYNSFDSRYTRAIGSGGFRDYNLRLSLEDKKTYKTFNIDKNNNPFPYLQPVLESYSTKREGELKAGYKGERLNGGLILNYAEDSWHYGRPNYYREDVAFGLKIPLTLTLYPKGRGDDFKISSTIAYEKRNTQVIKDSGGTDETGLSPYIRLISDTSSLNIELQAGLKEFNLGLVYGLEDYPYRLNDYFTDELKFELKDKIEKISVFGTYNPPLLPFWGLSLEISGRYDRYRYFDVSIYSSGSRTYEALIIKDSFNPKLSVQWKALESLTFRGSAGTGFIPPNVSSLYYKESTPAYQWLSNPDLKPERSLTVDAGIEGEFFWFKGGLTLFYTRWLDKMESLNTHGTPSIIQLQNIGESESKGVEVSLGKEFEGGWNSSFNYTFTMTEITKGTDTSTIGNELPNSPQHRANLTLSYEGVKDLTVRTGLRYESSQFTDSRNILRDERGFQWKKGEYYVADLSLVKKWKVIHTPADLTFAVDNLFDTTYQKGFFQIDPGRVIRGEIAVRF